MPIIQTFVHLVGFQTLDGSLSEDNTKSITAEYKTYLLSCANEKSVLSYENDVFEFKVDNPTNFWYAKEEIKKFIHPDGSLLVICEVKSLASEETSSMEPNTGLLYPNSQLTEHMKRCGSCSENSRHLLSEECSTKKDANYTDFFVRLVGFQTPDGSLSEETLNEFLPFCKCAPNYHGRRREYLFDSEIYGFSVEKDHIEIATLSTFMTLLIFGIVGIIICALVCKRYDKENESGSFPTMYATAVGMTSLSDQQVTSGFNFP
ncbi:hypothetical protein Ddc_10710 [Ditylenchus destructor]|nr:hypothetical protein Ddc_10710 [Ditylenchus destructor]